MKHNRSGGLMSEWTSIAKNKMMLLSLAAIAIVPLLYSFTYLWAFWDPYGKLNDLPVAVVNLDKGAVFENKELHIGQDFEDKLKEKGDFKYEFVSVQEARNGLRDNKYYLAFEIPEQFSENATKVLDAQPQPTSFTLMTNDGLNFFSSQIGRSAVERMKTEIAHELTKAYTETVFDHFGKLSDGLVKAADGAQDLADGSKKVQDGMLQINVNLDKLASSTEPLRDGVSRLSDGTGKLYNGAAQLKQGTSDLSAGLGLLNDGGKRLASGTHELQQGMLQLQSGLSSSVPELQKLQTGAAGVSAGLEALAKQNPQLAETDSFKQLLDAAKQVESGTASAAAGQSQMAAGADQLVASEGQLAAGADALSGKIGDAAAGAQKVDAGAGALVQGSADLQNGIRQLSSGVHAIGSGSAQLKDGAGQVVNGMDSVVQGSSDLSSKLADAAAQTSDVQTNEDNYAVIADPVHSIEEKNGNVHNYGTGLAPYFLSLALFVGGLMMTMIYPMRQTSMQPTSGTSWFLSKFGTVMVIGTLQALIASITLLYGLGLEVQNVQQFFMLSLLTSWCFMAIVQFMTAAFGDPGRFVIVLLLIAQLVSSGGTFPVELIPDALQKLHIFVPMTYSVEGFKAIIAGGEPNVVMHSFEIMGIAFVTFSLLSWAAYLILYKRFIRNNKQAAVTSA